MKLYSTSAKNVIFNCRRLSALQFAHIKRYEHKINTREQYKFRNILNSEETKNSNNQPNPEIKILKTPLIISSFNKERRTGIIDQENVYNQQNPTSFALSTACSGCGAKLHSQVAGEPGYINKEKYDLLLAQEQTFSKDRQLNKKIFEICLRCDLLQEYDNASQTTIDESYFEKYIIKEINKQKDSIIILVCDMTNLPHSLIPDLFSKINCKKYIVVGNKTDQLPIDGSNYLDRWRRALLESIIGYSAIPENYIKHVSLISAVTGFGVPSLVDALLSHKFSIKCPLYLVGTANVGKSSLFNRLLQSDLCKSEARESIHRATVSIWPGTTAGLLRFPLVILNSAKQAQRSEAKLLNKKSKAVYCPTSQSNNQFRYPPAEKVIAGIQSKGSALHRNLNKITNQLPDLIEIPTYSLESNSSDVAAITPDGDFIGEEQCLASDHTIQKLYSDTMRSDYHVDKLNWDGDRGVRLLSTLLNSRHYHEHAWCYDTPGVLSPNQIFNYLPKKVLQQIDSYRSLGSGDQFELSQIRGKLLVPRYFILKSGLSLLINLIGRLDVLQSPGPVYCVSFTHLPIHIVSTSVVDDYLKSYSNLLSPTPKQNQASFDFVNQIQTHLPAMHHKDMDPIETVSNLDQTTVDIVLSDAGWISVVGLDPRGFKNLKPNSVSDAHGQDSVDSDQQDEIIASEDKMLLRAWTPGALGIATRTPPLIPSAIRRRGKRIHLLREFTGFN